MMHALHAMKVLVEIFSHMSSYTDVLKHNNPQRMVACALLNM